MPKSEIFKEKVAQSPDNSLFRFSLGQALFEEGDAAASVEHLVFCVNSREDWMMPRIILGKAYLELENKVDAKPILEQALALAIDQHHEGPEAEMRQILETEY